MSANREVTIICNYCYSSWSLAGCISIRKARAEAAHYGWQHEGKKDFCSQEHALAAIESERSQ